MKNYQIEVDDYELSLLKYLVYERKAFLKKKHNEVPEKFKSGIQYSFQSAGKLLHKLVSIKSDPTDFYNYDLIERKDKSYNEYLKEYFNAK